jgi:hypothetical protein
MEDVQMSKIKTHIQDWLDNVGKDLGYDSKSTPPLKDLDVIRKHRLPIWEYYGFKTQEEYWEAKYSQTHDDDDFEPVEY